MFANKNNISFVVKIGAVAGIAGFIIEPLGIIALGMLKTGYSVIASTISELGETGGANYRIAGLIFILTGICEILFATAFYSRFKGSISALFAALFIAGHGIFDSIGSGFFPCDMGGKYESVSGHIHFIVSVIGLFFQILVPIFAAIALSKAGNKNLKKITIIAAIIILAGTAFFGVSFFTEYLVGLSQRIIYYAYFLWIVVMSVFMLKKSEI